jgi:hypothetical protein
MTMMRVSPRDLSAHRAIVIILLALCTFFGTRSIITTQRAEWERAASTKTAKTKTATQPQPQNTRQYYTLDDDLSNRSARFPSIDERVRVYTSDWYTPPCSNDQKLRYSFHAATATSTSTNTAKFTNHTRIPSWILDLVLFDTPNENSSTTTLQIPSTVVPDELFFLTQPLLSAPAKAGRSSISNCDVHPNMRPYCRDVDKTLWPALERTFNMTNNNLNTTTSASTVNNKMPPILLQFGDTAYSTAACADGRHVSISRLPMVKKFRRARAREQLAQTTAATCQNQVQKVLLESQQPQPQPVIWKLNTERHYGKLGQMAHDDIPWNNKTKHAVFRGTLTGNRPHGPHGHHDKKANDNHDDIAVCLRLDRCRLVYHYYNSSLLNARLTNTFGRVNKTIHGVPVQADRRLSLAEMLQFKGILILEGNDVATALKWALASRSVVLMPRPKFTSWAMEELLAPWVHYIPLNDDLTDVEEKIQWMIDNDEKSRHIGVRGALWMMDLVYHPNAARKNEELVIQQEILRRYAAHFAERSSQAVLPPHNEAG